MKQKRVSYEVKKDDNGKLSTYSKTISHSDGTPKVLIAFIIVACVIVAIGLGLFVKIQYDRKNAVALNGGESGVGETIPSEYLDAAREVVNNRVETPDPKVIYDGTLPVDGKVEIRFTDSQSSGVIDYIGSSDSYEHAVGTDKTYVHYRIVMTMSDVYPLNIVNTMFIYNGAPHQAKYKVKVNDGEWVNIEDLKLSDFGHLNNENLEDCLFTSGDEIEVIAYVDKIDGPFTVQWASPDDTQTVRTNSYKEETVVPTEPTESTATD